MVTISRDNLCAMRGIAGAFMVLAAVADAVLDSVNI